MHSSAATPIDLACPAVLDSAELHSMQGNWNHWQRNARRHGENHSASWGDRYAIDLEIRTLHKHMSAGGRLLDAGCANGYTTFHMLDKQPQEFVAFDYAPDMITHAKAAQPQHDPDRRIRFMQGNILSIPASDEYFDQVYTVRVLINLPSRQAQMNALNEIHRVLKPGGRYVLSEAFVGSLTRLNALRALAELPPLAVPEFNLYLEEEALQSALVGRFSVTCIDRFSSLYYVATRFLRDLAVEPTQPASYDDPLNRLAATLAATSRSGDFGIQKAYVLTKL